MSQRNGAYHLARRQARKRAERMFNRRLRKAEGKAGRVVDRKHQSRVTTGKYILPGVKDLRCPQARRFRDISAQIIVDQGGLDRCSEARLQLIRRFAAACVMAEGLEGKLVNGEMIDITDHALLCSTIVRVADRVGRDRRMRDITPHRADYIDIATKEQQEAEKDTPPEVPDDDDESDDEEVDGHPESDE